ncbi:hypothetical protein SAMN05444159_7596 [Bradyrhizobium lablabi]|uniref:Uncharacterized protein n=1 Tax=Bradyrhizobium lablabi TaxID=722472 RepID=A0A1M7FTI7_9BRAD|nr:hypothetical protein [Bradyrhizobium lablabi]SHM07235.1 hypothetical protein SAMN05444159_7596 [Bradyrhizobium lablabi]
MGIMGSAAATTAGATFLASQSAAAFAVQNSGRAEIDKLYEERTALAARSRELHAQYVAADASLPWWARAGHEYLRGDGTWTGGIVGWPAIDDDHKPAHYIVQLLKRPSPYTIRRDFERDLRFFGEKQRPEIRAKYRRRMRELVARLRCQREEERKAGLPELEAQIDAISDRIFDLNDRIENLDVSAADMPQKVAAVHMITQYRHFLARQPIGDIAVLMVLRPMLTGLIREHADFAAKDWEAPICSMPFYSS